MYPETIGALADQISDIPSLLEVVAPKLPPDLTLIATGSDTQHTHVTGLRPEQVLVEIFIKALEKSGQFWL